MAKNFKKAPKPKKKLCCNLIVLRYQDPEAFHRCAANLEEEGAILLYESPNGTLLKFNIDGMGGRHD
jgi:hypothetical protein